MQNDHQQYERDRDDDSCHHHPPRPPIALTAARLLAGVRTRLVRVGVARMCHGSLLSRSGRQTRNDRAHLLGDTTSVAIQSVSHIATFGHTEAVPKLWDDTIESHRRAVRDTTLDAAAALVAEHGLASVTMSEIAERTGIGRATLYRYFPDVEAILLAWHERQVSSHLSHLAAVRDRPGNAADRLGAVLQAYALMTHAHEDTDLAASLHRGAHVGHAQQHLQDFIRDLLAEGAGTGALRDDVPPAELAGYCLHALAAARALSSKAAVKRLVSVTLDGLRPPSR
jgi:AcrR family transcriptional regulator